MNTYSRRPLPADYGGAATTPFSSSRPSLPIRRGRPSLASPSLCPDPRRRAVPPHPWSRFPSQAPESAPPLSFGLESAPPDCVAPPPLLTARARPRPSFPAPPPQPSIRHRSASSRCRPPRSIAAPPPRALAAPIRRRRRADPRTASTPSSAPSRSFHRRNPSPARPYPPLSPSLDSSLPRRIHRCCGLPG
jgi:hypothetical protein